MASKGRTVPPATPDEPEATANGAVTVTPISAYRHQRDHGIPYRLPDSGDVMRLKPPPLLSLLLQVGSVQNPLAKDIIAILEGERAKEDATPEERLEFLAKEAHVCQELVVMCAVEPKVVRSGVEPGPGEISIDDMRLNDIYWISYTFAGGTPDRRELFRVKDDGGPAAPVGSGEGVRGASE